MPAAPLTPMVEAGRIFPPEARAIVTAAARLGSSTRMKAVIAFVGFGTSSNQSD